MKKPLHAAFGLIIFLVFGCGDENMSLVPQPTTHPVITASHFSQNVVNSTIDGSVDFEAPVDDVISILKTVTNSQGVVVYTDQPALNLPGVRTGTVPFSISYASFPAGTYTVKIQLAGLGFSNAATFSFTK